MSRRPSKHYSVATSITDTHRLSPYTVYHEIRKSWVMGPGMAVNAVGFLHHQETIARPPRGISRLGDVGRLAHDDCFPFCLGMTKHYFVPLFPLPAREHGFMCDCSSLLACAPSQGATRNEEGLQR